MSARLSAPWLLAGAVAVLPAVGLASERCGEDAMIVFDGSGSMAEVGFNDLAEARILTARRALSEAIPGVTTGRRTGLVIYGPGAEDSCENIDLRFPPKFDAGPKIVAEVEALEPSGDTPLTAAVERAAEVLRKQGKGGTILLITDGRETCDGDPCALAEKLAALDAELTVHVIGFKVRSTNFSWQTRGYDMGKTPARCLADKTGGQFHSAESARELEKAIEQTLGCRAIAGL